MRSSAAVFLVLPSVVMGALSSVHMRRVGKALADKESFHSDGIQSVIDEKARHMTREEAWRKVKSKDHSDVALFQKEEVEVNEETISKAREIMNGELTAAYAKLDSVMAKCSSEWQMYSDAYDTAVIDLNHIEAAGQDATSTRDTANQDAANYANDRKSAEDQLAEENKRWEQDAQTRNDAIQAEKLEMAVKVFVLSITGSQVEANPLPDANPGVGEGSDEASLVQASKRKTASRRQTTSLLLTKTPKKKSLLAAGMEVCLSASGKTEYKFADPKVQLRLEELQAKANRAFAKVQRQSLAAALGGVISLLEVKEHEPTTAGAQATQEQGTAAQQDDVEEGDPFAQRKRCDKVPQARYGMLHDRMASMFGLTADTINQLEKDYAAALALHQKDVRELTAHIDMYGALYEGANIRHGRALQALIDLAVAKTSTEDYKMQVEERRSKAKHACMKDIDTIMVDEVCGVKAVRDQIQSKSTEHPATDIQDCKFDNGWNESTCIDDEGRPIHCTRPNAEQRGGTKVLTRAIMDAPNELGAQCPAVRVENVPCAHRPCPIDCEIDDQDKHFGRCTALCDGGEATATLKIKTWPMYGGAKCGALTESEACNQQKCDQDCVLGTKVGDEIKVDQWGEWSHCSRACFTTESSGEQSAGFEERRKDVLIPALGDGECQPKSDPVRRQQQPCNNGPGQECVGDEICQAHMDLIFLIDSSGSVGRDNFRKMLLLVKETVERFEATAFEQPGVSVAAIKFGNGFIDESGAGTEYVISPAQVLHEWTTDYVEFGAALQAARHARGFTNLAQGYTRAEDLFQLPDGTAGSRTGAKITKVLVLTDGSVPFQKEAEDAFERLDNGGYRVNAVVFNDNPDVLSRWNSLVTHPAEASLISKSSFMSIETPAGRKTLITDMISSFCPKSESPSSRAQKEVMRGFELIREDFDCPSWIVSLNQRYADDGSFAVECINDSIYDRHMCRWKNADWLENAKAAAEDYGADMFVCGVSGWYEGHCFVEDKNAEDHDTCPQSTMPWADPNVDHGYVSTSGWAGGEFNVYGIVEHEVTQGSSTAA